MAQLWLAPQAELRIGPTISSVGSSAALDTQQLFVSQATQDTTINVGKSSVGGADDVTEVAQSFTADGPFISKVTAFVGKNGTPTDNIVCKIYNDSSNVPGTTLIATSANVTGASLADAPAATDFTFTEGSFDCPLTYGKKYWIVFDRGGDASDSNFFEVNYKGTASTVASHALARSDDDMSSWTADASGYDLYHVIYAGDLPVVKDLKVSGGERDVEAAKFLGYNELLDEKRSNVITATFTASFFDALMASGWCSGTPALVTGTSYYRTTGGEKSSNDRPTISAMLRLNDGTNTVVLLLNDAKATVHETSLSADGHAEQTITIKCLASDYYEEDDFA